jgi:hypothetical protein
MRPHKDDFGVPRLWEAASITSAAHGSPSGTGSSRSLRLTVVALCMAVLHACGGGGASTGSGGQPAQHYSVGGSVSGLSGSGLQLSDGSGTPLSVSANGAFTFPTQVASGASYAITIATQPTNPTQDCAVSNGSGRVGSANVTSITVTCGSVITADTAASVTSLGNTASETLMQLASFIGERLTYLSSHLAANTTETCADRYHQFTGGSASYVFSDKNGSGSLSAGDVVTITLTGCLSQSMADHVTGVITLTLTPTPAAPAGALAFAASAQLDSVQLTGLQVTGSLSIAYTAADTQYDVLATVAATPVQLAYQQNGGFFPTDTVVVSNANVSKTIDYTVPQYSVQIALDFQSQRLQGKFSVSTPQALTGRLGIYPDAGMEVFRGGPSVLNYAAQDVALNYSVTASLDENGSGNFVDLGSALFWEQGINGFPWWEPRGFSVVSINSRPAYSTTTLNMWQMGLMFTEPQQADPINGILSTGMDVSIPIKLFFNGPVDPTTASLVFATATYSIPGQVSVPAVLVINGPIIGVTPQSQLQHGEPYSLNTVNRVASPWAPALPGVSFQLQLTTLNNLQANASPNPGVAAPGQSVQLVSTGSFSTNSTIAAYSWTQTGGTTVAVSGANTATASFVVPASSKSGDVLQFTLMITDANGESDSVPVSVFVLTDLTQPFLFYHAQQVPTVGQEPEDATFESPVNGTITTTLDNTLNIFRFGFTPPAPGSIDILQFQPGNAAIVPGTYTSSNTTGGQPFMILSYNQCYSSTAWQLTIYEATAAPDGTAAKFSADFTLSCPGGGPPPITGSVRINSTVPLP